MSNLENYANWIVKNQDKKGTEDFEKVAKAYKLLLSQQTQKSGQMNVGSFSDLMGERGEQEDINFDYETGAPASIRALVSFGESVEDKEAILAKKVGATGYTKDSMGRLALTPEGQAKTGMTPLEKNVILDEKSVSMRDVADFAGIVPETAGAVIGGILGSAPGPIGVFTSAGGAAVGAMVGQTVEESIEGLLGVQKQEIKDVAKDVALEGALAGTVDLLTVGAFRAGKALIGGAGRRLAQGNAIDPIRGKRLVDEGFMPSLERLGAPTSVGYAQKFAEGAVKDDTRVMNNLVLSLQKKDAFLKNKANLEKAGESFGDVAVSRYNELDRTIIEAQNSAMKSVKDSIDFIEKSIDEGFDINTSTLDAIVNSFDNFQTVVNKRYNGIDEALSALEIGGTSASRAKVIPTNTLDGMISKLKEDVGSLGLLDGDLKKIITGINQLKQVNGGDLASFTQLVNQRRIVNETLFKENLSSFTTEQLYRFRDTFDELIDNANIGNLVNVPKDKRAAFQRIIKQRDKANIFYRDGLKKYDDLQKFGVMRSIREALNDNRFQADQFVSKIVWKNAPERLKAVLQATDNPEVVRSQLARSYLDKAMSDTSIDLMNPNRFNGLAFRNKIHGLGTTGKVLFGKNWTEVKKLADTIGQVGFKTLPRETLDNIIKQSPNKNIIQSMEDLANASKEFNDARNIQAVRKFNEGEIDKQGAIDYITRPNITTSEIDKLQKFFKGSTETYKEIQESVIHKLLQSVDEDIFSSPTSAKALTNAMKQYSNPGALRKILGDDSYNLLDTFAKDLEYLGDLGKEGSIYSATFAAHPISKWRPNLRFKTTARLFANPGTLKYFANRAVGTPNERANAVLNAINNSVDLTARTLGSGRQLTAQAVAEQVRNTGQELDRQFNKIEQQSTPPLSQSGLGQLDITQPDFRANPIIVPNPNTRALTESGVI